MGWAGATVHLEGKKKKGEVKKGDEQTRSLTAKWKVSFQSRPREVWWWRAPVPVAALRGAPQGSHLLPRATAAQPTSHPSTIAPAACSPRYPWGERSDDGGEGATRDRGGGPPQASGTVVLGCEGTVGGLPREAGVSGGQTGCGAGQSERGDAGLAEGGRVRGLDGYGVEGMRRVSPLPFLCLTLAWLLGSAKPRTLREQYQVLYLICNGNREATLLLQWERRNPGQAGSLLLNSYACSPGFFIHLYRERKVKCKSYECCISDSQNEAVLCKGWEFVFLSLLLHWGSC